MCKWTCMSTCSYFCPLIRNYNPVRNLTSNWRIIFSLSGKNHLLGNVQQVQDYTYLLKNMTCPQVNAWQIFSQFPRALGIEAIWAGERVADEWFPGPLEFLGQWENRTSYWTGPNPVSTAHFYIIVKPDTCFTSSDVGISFCCSSYDTV